MNKAEQIKYNKRKKLIGKNFKIGMRMVYISWIQEQIYTMLLLEKERFVHFLRSYLRNIVCRCKK